MLIDTHAHLNFPDFYDDGTEIARESLKNNVWVINAGTNCLDSKNALEIANNFEEGVYASVGVHPGAVLKTPFSSLDLSLCKELAREPKVVAVGETGLDYHYLSDMGSSEYEQARHDQQELFEFNLQLSRRVDKPLILHCRDAYEDLIEVMKQNNIKDGGENGVAHCFAGDIGEMRAFLEMGFYIGFTGIITFSKKLNEVIRETPMDRILVETDSPFLTPYPHRGERNYPVYVEHVAEKIAKVKGERIEKIIEQTTKNARELFGI